MDAEHGTGRAGFRYLARKLRDAGPLDLFFRKLDRLGAWIRCIWRAGSRIGGSKLDKEDEQAALRSDNETLRSILV